MIFVLRKQNHKYFYKESLCQITWVYTNIHTLVKEEEEEEEEEENKFI